MIALSNGTDTLAIFGGYRANPIESFEFADGEVMSLAEVRAAIFDSRPAAAQDILDLRDLPSGREYRPGQGNDLVTLAQNSRVVFSAGDGVDTVIVPQGVTAAVLVFENQVAAGTRIRPVANNSSDLLIAFPGTGDQVIIRNALTASYLPELEFSDGTVWSPADLLQRYVTDQTTDGNDIVEGTGNADVIIGGFGDDQIRGGAGDDSYKFVRGDGRDVIADSAGIDTLVPRQHSIDRLAA